MADTLDLSRAPAPIPSGPESVSAHDLVIADLESWYSHELHDGAVAQLRERKRYGLKKYGTILHKDDDRPAGQDTEDEALDLVVYLRNWMDKHPDMQGFLIDAYSDALFVLITVTCLRHDGFSPTSMAKMRGALTPLAEVREQHLHSTDTGVALRGDIPRGDEPIYICGGVQRNEKVCARPLDEDGWCWRHGLRRIVA